MVWQRNNYAQSSSTPATDRKQGVLQLKDIYEQEADAMADRVMRMKNDNPVQTFLKPPIHTFKKIGNIAKDKENYKWK